MEIENAVNQAKRNWPTASTSKEQGGKSRWRRRNQTDRRGPVQGPHPGRDVIGKLAKRSISMKNIEQAEPDISPLGHARQAIKIKQGIETTVAKEITGFIRRRPIQGDDARFRERSRGSRARVAKRVAGVMGAVRGKEFPVALQFQNFRD